MANLSIRPAGDTGLLLDLGPVIDPVVNRRTRDIARRLGRELASLGAGEVIAAYATVLVTYSPLDWTYEQMERIVRSIVESADSRTPENETPASKRFVLPVVYGGAYGPDLEDVAILTGLTPEEVVARHAHRDYPIYCLGFAPGFPYLGGLDPALGAPRLETPRPSVPAGSVGIGGSQTGVYPTATPGGWRLIGRTPLVLFDVSRSPPVPYSPGDVMRFEPIDAGEYEVLATRRDAPVGRTVSSLES